jgi:glycosyltransferase involved in cell wall biosynthesis
MCVLEALGCGLPVASTDVGEIRRVIHPGTNGEIAIDRTSKGLAAAVLKVLENIKDLSGAPCVAAVAEFVPQKVLAPVYQAYREMTRRRDR